MKRRTFLQTTSAVALGTLAFPQFLTELKKVGTVGIQLYTVRDAMQKDLMGTLQKVAQIGYKDVELAGYNKGKFYGKTPTEFKKILDDLGLKTTSTHMGLNVLKEGWQEAVDGAATLGETYIVCPFVPKSEFDTADKYKALAEVLNKSGEIAKKSNIQLAYHNHDFEFDPVNGQLPYDILLKETDADLLKMELDIYWIQFAGKDPLAYFNNHPGRFHLWHVKDMDNTAKRFFTSVGSGVIDWKPIFKAAKKSGLQHFYVEQDAHANNQPMENIEASYKYLKNLRY
jgi:sugar phosphate isomerase/epimerase